ncbi:MAG: thioesterase family protein, partial [Deltaproteobacteria bacterium]|nr:thioesterase family protein [Deltaproteobacteria bacterium]
MPEKKKNIERIVQLFHEMNGDEVIPFNKLLGFHLESLDEDRVCIKFEMKEDLIGNIMGKVLHGGVIAGALDSAGGFIAGIGLMSDTDNILDDQILKKFLKMGTIDLRVDYLRPGKGKYFLATGSIMRMGKKV